MQQAATVPGGEPNPLDSTGLCLLSLDGGGVRGLSTLYILKGLMDRLNQVRPKGAPIKKPCEVFDLIGGTSTGGLIAIMLGRLEMDVDECIIAYVRLMKTVFEKSSTWSPLKSLFGNIESRFDASKLEGTITDVIHSRGASIIEPFNNRAEHGCRVFACSITQETKEIVRLRNYTVPGKPDIPATICQAARATSAATSFFDPVSIGARRFADGALGANNPVDEVEGEASDIWCPETGDLKPLVKCFISIGTGNPGKKAMEGNLFRYLSKTLPELTTETEQTEKKFIAKWRQHYDSKQYFRFNVDQGLQDVGLAEYQEQGLIEAATEGYLDHQAVRFQVRDCIQNLESKQNRAPLNFAVVINDYHVHLQERSIIQRHWHDRTRWHVPFERNHNFIGRKELFEDIQQRLQQYTHTARIAVVGLGGVGKTQLVLELAYHMREQCAVFWIPVNNLANLQTAYYEVAKKLRLPGCEKNGDHILKLVQTYLSDESIGPWLLALDNADDLALWTSPLSQESERMCLIDLLPKSTQGSIIFTTRNSKVGVDLAHDVVEVPAMDESGASQLLHSYLVNKKLVDTDCHVVPALLKHLTYLPLAIVQAASYINKNRTSLSAYKDLLLDKKDSAMDLLEHGFQDYGRYRDIVNAVATTWFISFEQICREDHLAAEYLCLMACVGPKNIPESLLPQRLSRTDQISAIGTLDAYSFLKRHTDGRTFDIHRLVHLATRAWLKSKEELSVWQSEAVHRLGELLADADETNRTKWKAYISHAQFSVLDHTQTGDEIIDLAGKSGTCLEYEGRFREAETMYRMVFGHRGRVLGPKHPDTLSSINNLALVLSCQGKYEDAEVMHRQTLRDRERVLGPKHPHTLSSINNLASVLSSQGKNKEAEAMFKEALEGSEKVLGLAHPDTLTNMNNLALVLSSQSKYEDAEVMHRQTLRDRERVLGPKHPHTLSSINNLALVLDSQGKYEEAEVMHRWALKGLEKVLGPEHPHTVTNVNNLALVLSSQSKYEEAEAMHRQVLSYKEKVLRPEHPLTLTSINNLASVLYGQGKYEEAEAMHRQALEGSEKVLGPEHPLTLKIANDLQSFTCS